VGLVTRVAGGQQVEKLWWWAARRRHGEVKRVLSRKSHPRAQSSLAGGRCRRVAAGRGGVLGSAGFIGMRVE